MTAELGFERDDARLVEPTEPPKMSLAAVIGFVCSFLLVLAPLGVLLGIVGIVRTGGGRRRGRGLAVAAVPIGLVMSLFVLVLGVSGWAVWRNWRSAREATTVLQTSAIRVGEESARFYRSAEERFRLALTQPQFEAWLAGVIKKHGSLQNIKPAQKNPAKSDPVTGEWSFNFVGEFVNGPAHVQVVMAPLGTDEPKVRNLVVDGVAAIPEALASPDQP